MSSSSAANNASGNSDATPKVATVIAQYIFLRRDLDWPAGAMAAQAAHASVAAIAQGLAAQHVPTAAYVSAENLPRMTKMVYGVDNLEQLEQVRDTWNTFIQSSNEVDASIENTTTPGECLHAYWWVEQPENIPSALATWPLIRTNKVSKLIKKLKLSYF